MRFIYFAVLLLAGCASIDPNQCRITFESNPPGATISDESGSWGVSPQTRIWTLNGPTSISNLITATWISGATTSTKMNLTAGREGTYTFQRPQGTAGLDQDIKWAMHLDRQEADRDSARAASLQRILDSQKSAPSAPPLDITCTKPLFGGMPIKCSSY